MTRPGMKQRLRNGETLGGYLTLIPSPVSVQAIAAAPHHLDDLLRARRIRRVAPTLAVRSASGAIPGHGGR